MTQPIAARLLPDGGDYEVTYLALAGGAATISFDLVPAAEIGPVLESIAAYEAARAATPPDPAMLVARELAAERAGMRCTRMQGILALGPVRWGAVLAYRATASWGEQVVIDSASDWLRLSQNIQFFAYLLGLTEAEVDELFRTAAEITA